LQINQCFPSSPFSLLARGISYLPPGRTFLKLVVRSALIRFSPPKRVPLPYATFTPPLFFHTEGDFTFLPATLSHLPVFPVPRSPPFPVYLESFNSFNSLTRHSQPSQGTRPPFAAVRIFSFPPPPIPVGNFSS